MKRKKKTAIELLLLEFKRRKAMLDNIDDEQSYQMDNIIHLTELYLSNEKKQIIKAYESGCIGEVFELNCNHSSEQYYNENYGK